MHFIPLSNPDAVVCELRAPRKMIEAGLAEIVGACARDLGQPVEVIAQRVSSIEKEAVLTLHLSAKLATSQHQVWCLACRLACFCPDTRVSVLIHGQEIFPEQNHQYGRVERRMA